jgi:glycine cleavage system H protein
MVALFVAMMFIGFILVDVALQKTQAWQAARAAAARAGRDRIESWVVVPEGVHLAKGHSWSLALQEGTVRAGADSLIARAMGTVSRVALPSIGEWVEAGSPLCRLELRDRSITLTAPVSGRVAAVNEALQRNPEMVSSDPYGQGWICSLEEVQAQPAYFGQRATWWLRQEVDRFRRFLEEQLAPSPEFQFATSRDAGVPTPGALAQCGTDVWKAFEREFVSKKG